MTNTIHEIGDASTILAIGTNTPNAHPVVFDEIHRAVRRGAKLITVNPREIGLMSRFSNIWLRLRPGTDVALINGMMKVILDEGLEDQSFISSRCENYEEFVAAIKKINLEQIEKITLVPRASIAEAARLYATNKPSSIIYAMGITQHSHGTDNVLSLSNLAMLTGNVGKPSTGVNPLRGHNNVQGACDMGVLPDVCSGYQKVTDQNVREKFGEAWGCSILDKPGLTLMEIIDSIHSGKIKALYLMGENPAITDPYIAHSLEALSRLEFMVVQDLFLSETAKLAHVVFPACNYVERDGTFTNTERRVQLLRKAIEPQGDSRPDWWIVSQVAKR
ncbi:MAG: molybdopterin-dependent oxidoreductase, partial [Dehalococcoidia bacterium]|nr:molybdopterin-dependent oxidoreductase [Dehalococcoidia bacterium]